MSKMVKEFIFNLDGTGIHRKIRKLGQRFYYFQGNNSGICKGVIASWEDAAHTGGLTEFYTSLYVLRQFDPDVLATPEISLDDHARLQMMDLHMNPDSHHLLFGQIYHQYNHEIIAQFSASQKLENLGGYARIYSESNIFTRDELEEHLRVLLRVLNSVPSSNHNIVSFNFDIAYENTGHAFGMMYHRSADNNAESYLELFDINRGVRKYHGDTAPRRAVRFIFDKVYFNLVKMNVPEIALTIQGRTVQTDNCKDRLAEALMRYTSFNIESMSRERACRSVLEVNQVDLAVFSNNEPMLGKLRQLHHEGIAIDFTDIQRPHWASKMVEVIYHNNMSAFRALLKRGNLPGVQMLCGAIATNRLEFIQYLYKKGMIDFATFNRSERIMDYAVNFANYATLTQLHVWGMRFTVTHYLTAIKGCNADALNFFWTHYRDKFVTRNQRKFVNCAAQFGQATILGIILDHNDDISWLDADEIARIAIVHVQPQILHLLNARGISWGERNPLALELLKKLAADPEIIDIISDNQSKHASAKEEFALVC